jgi:hypothetical protein
MDEAKHNFLSAIDAWLCDGYSLDIRYVARPTSDGPELISAAIAMYPLEASKNLSFSIATDNILCGQLQRYPATKRELVEILTAAIQGNIVLADTTLRISSKEPNSYYSEMAHRDRWFYELHLQISGRRGTTLSAESLSKIDNDLRASHPPFDGLLDLNTWLGTDSSAIQSGGAPAIVIRVGPPVDLIFDRCRLHENHLSLVFHAHPSFDSTRIGLAIRGTPSDGLNGRLQIADRIKWGPVTNNRREGTASIDVLDCDSALTILMIGTSTIRRQWITDPNKARNNRYMAVNHFDRELRKIRTAILESADSAKFEQGIAALLFLLGYSPAQQLETDSPDLIVTTPGGQLLLIECTLKTSDLPAKLGKLVDRRGSLTKSLASAGHQTEILAVLVCQLPRNQIAAHNEELRSRKVLLLAHEDLASGFDRVRYPTDPDKIVAEARAALQSAEGDLRSVDAYATPGFPVTLM